jgi:hypothetical protein
LIYSLAIGVSATQTRDNLQPIREIVAAFLDALRYGFFGANSAVVAAKPDYAPGADLKSGILEQRFDSDPVPEPCFLVLSGMLSALNATFPGTVTGLDIVADGRRLQLADLSLDRLTVSAGGRIALDAPPGVDLRDPFVLFLVFPAPLTKPQKEILRGILATWEALLIGGLPPSGAPSGTSMIGRSGGYFSEPTVFHYSVEGISAHPICLVLLLNALTANRSGLRVESIEIQ